MRGKPHITSAAYVAALSRPVDPAKIAGAQAVLQDHANGHDLLTPNAARPLLGKNGKRLDLCTVHRLFVRGRRAVDGSLITLEYAITTSGRCTSRPAIERFYRRLNGLDASTPSPVEMDRQHAEATSRLTAAGI